MTTVRCHWCNKKFISRSDAKWCSQRCRTAARCEDAKFVDRRPGAPGVSFSRFHRRWHVYIKDDAGKQKYVGSRKTREEAIAYRKEFEINGSRTERRALN